MIIKLQFRFSILLIYGSFEIKFDTIEIGIELPDYFMVDKTFRKRQTSARRHVCILTLTLI